jgi:hypothetical protein
MANLEKGRKQVFYAGELPGKFDLQKFVSLIGYFGLGLHLAIGFYLALHYPFIEAVAYIGELHMFLPLFQSEQNAHYLIGSSNALFHFSHSVVAQRLGAFLLGLLPKPVTGSVFQEELSN